MEYPDTQQNNGLLNRRQVRARTEITWLHWYGLSEEEKQLSQNQPHWWTKQRSLSDEEQQNLLKHNEKIKTTLQFQYKGDTVTVACCETQNLVELRDVITSLRNEVGHDFMFKADGQLLSCQEECRIHAFQLKLQQKELDLFDPNDDDGSYSDSSDNGDASLQSKQSAIKRLSEQGTKLTILSNNVKCAMYCMEHHTLSDIRLMIPHVLHPCQLPPARNFDHGVGLAYPGHSSLPLNWVRPDEPFTFETSDGPVLYEQDEDRITVANVFEMAEDAGWIENLRLI